MRMVLRLSSRVTTLFLGLCLVALSAWASDSHYVITNDDAPPNLLNGISIYSMAPDGQLTYQQSIRPGGFGIGGGFFGQDRIRIVDTSEMQCVYFSEAYSGDIVGVVLPSGTIGSTVTGSPGDTGTSNGIGLVLSSQYLYASFTDSNTIGTFQIQPNCGLTFVNDISVVGLQAGVIDAMAVHGDMLIVTFGDGSIESFNISGGTPVPNGDEQNSTAYNASQGSTYPSAVDITADGHFAIFGDTANFTVVEVSDISSGLLTKTVVYQTLGLSSSNVMLSPDETLLYFVSTQGDRVGAAFFDKNTGKIASGCVSGLLRGYVQNWSYLAGLTLAENTGTGGEVYIAEFGSPSSIAEVRINSLGGGRCSLQEAPNSPASDSYSPGLLSIGTFPPRSF